MLVSDNLSTHTPAALYDAFTPDEARPIAARIEWHYTPKHGSSLDVAEIEHSLVTKIPKFFAFSGPGSCL